MLSGSYKPGFMYEKSTDGLQGRSCYNTGLFYMRFRMCSLGEQKPVWRERAEGQKGVTMRL